MGQGTTTYTLDFGRGNRILAETMPTSTVTYLYGHDCLGQYDSAEDEWLYYLNDATGYVRQGADEQGQACREPSRTVVSNWLFDPDGTMLEGPQGLVSHLICGGVYDWSTGLIFKGGRYFDPSLGIWLALVPLVVIQSWRGRKRRRGMPWYVVVLLFVGVGGMLAGCGPGPLPGDIPMICTATSMPAPGVPTPPADTSSPYDYDPREKGDHDEEILAASVIIEGGRLDQWGGKSLGTIVGEEGGDWIIYTHNHFELTSFGKKLSDQEVSMIRLYDHNMGFFVQLFKIAAPPEVEVEEEGQRTKLRVRQSALDRTEARGKLGNPIDREDGAVANVGDEVDIAYLAPYGDSGDHVEIWHTRVVERPDTPPGTVAVLGTPAPGETFGPGGEGDSGGGLFHDGVHIGNNWQWAPSVVRGDNLVTGETNIPIRHSDAYWISYLNP